VLSFTAEMTRAYGTTRRVIFGRFILHLQNDTASNVVRVDGHEGLMIQNSQSFPILNQCLLNQLEASGGAVG